jgi:hypothetical protein
VRWNVCRSPDSSHNTHAPSAEADMARARRPR